MKKIKIRSIKMKNFRGAREEVSLDLIDGKSLLLYGDNGTGKSSFLDALEWFVTDSISHLSGEEVDKYEAIRNASSDEEDESYVEIKLLNSSLLHKTLSKKGKKSKPKDSRIPEQRLMDRERIWIRGHQLTSFVLETKKNRLADLSDLIGYAEVSRVNDILKKTTRTLWRKIRDSGFERRINREQETISQKLGHLVNNNERQFYEAVNDSIEKRAPSFLDSGKITDKEKLRNIVERINASVDQSELGHQQKLQGIKIDVDSLLKEINKNSLKESFESYLLIFNDIKKNPSELKNVSFLSLYKEAQEIISHQNSDNCPLCDTAIEKDILVDIVVEKIKKLEGFDKKIQSLDIEKEKLLSQIDEIEKNIKGIMPSVNVDSPKDYQKNELEKSPEKSLEKSLEKLSLLSTEIKKDIQEIDSSQIVLPDLVDVKTSVSSIRLRITDYLSKRSDSSSQDKISLLIDIRSSMDAFKRIQEDEKEKNRLNEYLNTFQEISSDFNSSQRNEMEKILGKISLNINNFYSCMSSEGDVSSIKLNPVEKNGEFSGVAFNLKFFEKDTGSPKSYLSESRLNCLGLSIFLASVVLFNKNTKFFILDDVISSFDKNHRYRFSQLLRENFSDYQLIVLTHEAEWFNLFAPKARELGWVINETFWDREKGIQIKIPLLGYKEKIDAKIAQSDVNDLGNLIRKYAESILKEICKNLDIPIPFRDNINNERRTLWELSKWLTKSSKESSLYSLNKNLFDRFSDCRTLTNQSSHDSNEYQENLPDMIAAYKDIENFKNIFICSRSNRFLVENTRGKLKTILCGFS